jgi:hypothetical protein
MSSFKTWFVVGILRFQKWFDVDVLGFHGAEQQQQHSGQTIN